MNNKRLSNNQVLKPLATVVIKYIYYVYTVKPVFNDHLYDKIYYLWFIQ